MVEAKHKHPLETIKWGVLQIQKYRGCLVVKNKNGYCIFGRKVKTEKEVDDIIDKGLNSIENSIIK